MALWPAAKPGKTKTAILLLYASWGLGVLRALWELPSFTRMESKGLAGGTLVTLIIIFALMLFLIFMTARGRNWARLTFLALYLIGMVMLVVGLSSGAPIGGGVGVDLVQAVVQLAALVMLFLPESNAWFREMKAARAKG